MQSLSQLHCSICISVLRILLIYDIDVYFANSSVGKISLSFLLVEAVFL